MTDKTKTISVRLPVETADELEETLKNQGLTLRKMLTGIAKGENFAPKDGVYTQFDGEIARDIEGMAKCFGMTLEEMMEGVCEGLTYGSLTVMDGRVVGIPDVNLETLYDKCHEVNVDPQDAIDRLVKEMER